ncbi:MAG: hypothetical protein H6561_17090 [Lewinellaceae bacterium]|nr:hypothetical protein [Lewinellaceae bacterium]
MELWSLGSCKPMGILYGYFNAVQLILESYPEEADNESLKLKALSNMETPVI